MAFDNLDGVKVLSYSNGQKFLIGDYFTVYDGDGPPIIYHWKDVTSVNETRQSYIIATSDEMVYKIDKILVPDTTKQLVIRAIIEGNIAKNPSISYRYKKRILPPKIYYTRCDMPERAYVSKGVYNEKEISYSNVTLLNTRLGKVFWLIGAIATIVVFAACQFFVGDILENFKYFIPISIFGGLISAMFVYILCAIVAKYIYAVLAKVDVALDREITFVISEEGFAAIESDLYSGSEVVRWSEVAYFIETNLVFIIFKNKKAVFWLPKRFFSKEHQKELSNFIAARLHQK